MPGRKAWGSVADMLTHSGERGGGFQPLDDEQASADQRSATYTRPGKPVKRFSIASARLELTGLRGKMVQEGSKRRVSKLVHAVAALRSKIAAAGGVDEERAAEMDQMEPHQLHLVHEGAGRIFCLAFSHDGRLFASGGNDKKIIVRQMPKGTLPHATDLMNFDSDGTVRCVAFSADDEFIASGGDDKKLTIYSLAGGAATAAHPPIQSAPPPPASRMPAARVAVWPSPPVAEGKSKGARRRSMRTRRATRALVAAMANCVLARAGSVVCSVAYPGVVDAVAFRRPQHRTAPHSTAQHRTAPHSTAQHRTAQHSTA